MWCFVTGCICAVADDDNDTRSSTPPFPSQGNSHFPFMETAIITDQSIPPHCHVYAKLSQRKQSPSSSSPTASLIPNVTIITGFHLLLPYLQQMKHAVFYDLNNGRFYAVSRTHVCL